MKCKHFVLTALLLILGTGVSLAQYEDDNEGYDNYYDYESNPDSVEEESYDEYDYQDYGQEEDAPKKPEKKPYVRIVMPYDTITELIHYTGVVVQEDSYYDSLYIRAKRYLIDRFKLKEKDFTESNASMDNITKTLRIPYKMNQNKHVVVPVGDLEFKLVLRFKDGKYKYDIDHLKHVYPVDAAGDNRPEYAYLEYYMNSTKNIVYYDKLLRAADKEINLLIAEIGKALREPVFIDEDDW